MSASALQSSSPSGDVREIPLIRGRVAIVDATDFDWLNQWTWRLHSGGTGYAYRYAPVEGKSTLILMHRQVMGAERRQEVDHANRDGLDNRRANLRLCSRSQNMCNRSRAPGASGYRGVYVDLSKSKIYRAQLTFEGKRTSLGRYATAEEAARAYDAAAREIHGPFAVLNFP